MLKVVVVDLLVLNVVVLLVFCNVVFLLVLNVVFLLVLYVVVLDVAVALLSLVKSLVENVVVVDLLVFGILTYCFTRYGYYYFSAIF